MGFDRDLFIDKELVKNFLCSICLDVYSADALQVIKVFLKILKKKLFKLFYSFNKGQQRSRFLCDLHSKMDKNKLNLSD
jgi:hypothetical protein